MSAESDVVPLTAIAVTPKACGGCLLTPKIEFNPMFDPGTGANPNALYTQPIEISVPVAGVNSRHSGVVLGVGVIVGVIDVVGVIVGVILGVGVFVDVGVGVTKALHNWQLPA
jgi:hypothetical protein